MAGSRTRTFIRTKEEGGPPGQESGPPPRSRPAWLNALVPVLGLILVYGLFGLLKPDSFLQWNTAQTIVRHSIVTGLAALGMTLLMRMGGIDLSVGSVLALGTVATALVLRAEYQPALVEGGQPTYYVERWPMVWPVLAAGAGVAACIGCGLLNGLLITRLQVVPFIVTLGMMLVVRGVARWLASDQTVNVSEFARNECWIGRIASQQGGVFLGVAPSIWLLAVMALVVGVLLHLSRLGRHLTAVGSNEATARLCGVPVNRTKVIVYALGGFFVGLASVVLYAENSQGDPTSSPGKELDVIAAVVIGGGSLSGGEGLILGSLAGAIFLEVIATGCAHLHLPAFVQLIVTGMIIVAAVTLDRWRQRRAGG